MGANQDKPQTTVSPPTDVAAEDPVRSLAARTQELAQSAERLNERVVRDLTRTWKRLRSMEQNIDGELQGSIEDAFKMLDERMVRQREERERSITGLKQMLDELETTLQQGQLQQSTALHKKLVARVSNARGSSAKGYAAISTRLHAATTALHELNDWRRWGTDRARQELIEQIEALLDSDLHPGELAKRIHQARETWKKWDRSGSPARKNLWKRFDKACTEAYAPCKEHFARLAGERQANYEKRVALCHRLEQSYASTDWKQVDWRAADKLVKQAHQQWRRRQPIDRHLKKDLDQRFKQVIEQYESHLDHRREIDVKRRRKLIATAEALVQSRDTSVAITQINQLQLEWQPTVLASVREEQRLWQQFRAACDAVYDRRKQERNVQSQELRENLAKKLTLCETLEKLIETNDTSVITTNRLVKTKEEWNSIGGVPKKSTTMIEKRFKNACDRFTSTHAELDVARHQAQIVALKKKSDLCRMVENIVGGSKAELETTIEQAEAEWSLLPECDDTVEALIRQRFDTAKQSPATLTVERRAQNQTTLEDLCLRLEVLAAIDSPPEAAEARLRLQVERLSEAMKGGSAAKQALAPASECWEIERSFYLCGPAPLDQTEKLVARFNRARDAFYAKQYS